VAVCCRLFPLAVIVTVDVAGGVPLVFFEVPPPQAAINPTETTANTSGITCRRRLRKPARQTAAAIAVIGAVIGKSGFMGRREADDAATEIVSCVVTAAPEGVTCDGLKLQFAPDGRPEQLKLTAESKPPIGVTVSVVVPCPPESTVNELAAELSVNPPAQFGRLKEAIRVAQRFAPVVG
jgi:hypothetical protein